jgi:Tol biopolymer transport system component
MFSNQRRRSTQRWALTAVTIVIVILGILGMPRIAQVQPAPDSKFVPSTASIRITFNRPMDRISVESRLTIEPPQSGHFEWDGDGVELTFVPDEPWPEGESISYVLGAGSRTNFFLPVLRTQRWSFDVGTPRIAYLWPAGGLAQLYARSLSDGETAQLTNSPLGVLDFAVSYEGAQIVYTALTADGGSEIWHLDLVSEENRLILECQEGFRCQEPQLSPNLEELVFERFSLEAGIAGSPQIGASEIWKIRMGDDAQAFRLSTSSHTATSPSWSPKGLIAYYDVTSQEIVIVEPVSLPEPAVRGSITNELGVVGTWTADGVSLVFPDMVILDETYSRHEPTGDEFPLFYSHLFRQSIDFGLREDLSSVEFELVEDASPVLSPDGQWIAFSRKFLQEDSWTPGRQVWVMQTDGSDASQVTDVPDNNHSSLAWNPEGTALSFVRINQNDFGAGPEVWIYEFETEELKLLSSGGFLPQWIP